MVSVIAYTGAWREGAMLVTECLCKASDGVRFYSDTKELGIKVPGKWLTPRDGIPYFDRSRPMSERMRDAITYAIYNPGLEIKGDDYVQSLRALIKRGALFEDGGRVWATPAYLEVAMMYARLRESLGVIND